MSKILIIGAGMMGSAMSLPACDKGHEVHLIGTHLDREIIAQAQATGRHIRMDRPLPEAAHFHQLEALEGLLPGSDFVICGVSSFGLDWFADRVLPLLPEGLPVLSVTKGLLDTGNGGLKCYPDYFEARDPRRSFAAIGGPCTSYELADRRHSSVAFCGRDLRALRMMREALRTDYYHISLTDDVMGLEAAVALKNAYALAVTLAVSMAQDAPAYNPQAALFAQSVREMRSLLRLLNCREENISWGAGDLYVTVFGGRTRRLGSLLGQGLSITEALERLEGVTLESVVITGRVLSALREREKQGSLSLRHYPLLSHVGALLDGHQQPIPWADFESLSGFDQAGQ